MARVIKRYENRKLYDVEAKRYVRLSELIELIRAGEEIQVIDNVNGADITVATLAKAISEGSEPSYLPSRVLHEILRAGGNVVTSGVNQIEQVVNRVVQRSLERAGSPREIHKELAELRGRLSKLEALVGELENSESGSEESHGRNDDGRRERGHE